MHRIGHWKLPRCLARIWSWHTSGRSPPVSAFHHAPFAVPVLEVCRDSLVAAPEAVSHDGRLRIALLCLHWRRLQIFTMSFRLNLPDGRAHKEEDVTQARLAAMRNSTLAATTPREGTPLPGDMKLDGSLSVDTSSPALSPGPGRRHVVFPDPVAFRCALRPIPASLFLPRLFEPDQSED